jgi:hypothetical protein
MKLLLLLALLVVPASGHAADRVADDAEILSRRVSHQAYGFGGEWAGLRKDEAIWGIPIWACDPATLTIHTTNLKEAPYAVRIVTGHRNPIWNWETYRSLDFIHLLAMSKEDAVRIRRALIGEIAEAQRSIEKRQGNRPGFLKEKARAKR